MYILVYTAIFMNILSLIVMILSTSLSKKMIEDREKASPFECGFDPQSSSRIPFSLHFFLIAIIFLIFDVEITLILPMIMLIPSSSIMSWLMTSITFMLILLLGLYHEWNQKMLTWTL